MAQSNKQGSIAVINAVVGRSGMRGADDNAPRPMEDTFIHHFRNMLPDDYPHLPHYHEWGPPIWEWLAKRGVDPRKAVYDGNKWKFD